MPHRFFCRFVGRPHASSAGPQDMLIHNRDIMVFAGTQGKVGLSLC